MPTLSPVRKHRKSINALNASELLFVKHLIADDLWRPLEAARRAGFENPNAAASRLMKRPYVQAALGSEQRRRLERLQVKADDVLHMLATGLFFNPLSLFKPGANGKWVVTDLDKVPDEIGRIIEEVKVKTVETIDENDNVTVTTYFELKTISKGKLLEMAMKHCGIDGTQKIEHTGNVGLQVNFSLNELLMDVEASRCGQIVDGEVVNSRLVEG